MVQKYCLPRINTMLVVLEYDAGRTFPWKGMQ